jgi:hypothetical protein
MIQNYVQIAVSRKDKPTFEMWTFAAEYSFFELEEYCRSDGFVFVILRDILRRPGGLEVFLQHRIPAAVMSRVITNIVGPPGAHTSKEATCPCRKRFYSGDSTLQENVCSVCKDYYFAMLRGIKKEKPGPVRRSLRDY